MHHLCNRDAEQAVATLQRAIALDPEFAHAHFALGQAYEIQQKWDQAISTYNTVIELDATFKQVYPYLAQIYVQKNQPQQAQQVLDQVIPQVTSQDFTFDARYSDMGYLEAQPLIAQGIQKLDQGKLSEAEQQLRMAINLNPSNTDAAFALSDVLVQRGQIDAALNVVEQTFRYNLKRTEGAPKLQSVPAFMGHQFLAQYFIRKGDNTTAIAILRKTIEKLYQDEELFLTNNNNEEEIEVNRQTLMLYRNSLPIELGTLLVQEGKPEEALTEFRKALSKDRFPLTSSDFLADLIQTISSSETQDIPETDIDRAIEAKSYQYLGEIYSKKNKLSKAILAYKKGLDSVPSSLRLLQLLGFTQVKNNQIPEALNTYQKHARIQNQKAQQLEDEPTLKVNASRTVVDTLIRLQRFEQAIERLQSDLASSMPTEEAYLHQEILARVYRYAGSEDLAIEVFQRILPEAPADRKMTLQSELVSLQIGQKQYDQAKLTAQAMISQFPKQQGGYGALAELYAHQQQPQKAIETALTLSPQVSPEEKIDREIQFNFQLGNMLKRAQNYEAALGIYRQLVSLLEKTQQSSHLEQAQFKLAEIHLLLGQYDAAIPLLNRVTSSTQNTEDSFSLFFHGAAHSLLGKIYTQQGNYTKAIAAYRRGQDLSPKLPVGEPLGTKDLFAYSSLSQDLDDLGKPQDALNILNTAVQFIPSSSLPFQLRGRIHEAQGNLNTALQDYQTAIDTGETSLNFTTSLGVESRTKTLGLWELYLRSGRILLKQNKPAEAQVQLEKALSYNPLSQEAQVLLEKAIAQTQGKESMP